MNRRVLLGLIAGTMTAPARVGWSMPLPPPPLRPLHLVNPHTQESFYGVYRDQGGPIGSVMDDLGVFLRDFHCDQTHAMDVNVLDFLASVMAATDQTTAYILSAYRTPATNAMLARTTFGVAENSQHLYGRALDVHFDRDLAKAMTAAREMRRGGVGWYPHSGFMHIDSGPVRNWDLDETGLGTLLFEGGHIHFDERGEPVVSATERAIIRRYRPTVQQMLFRRRVLARAEFIARQQAEARAKFRQRRRLIHLSRR